MSDIYSAIDPILMLWARDRALHVYTECQETPVRSILVFQWHSGSYEPTGQIWLTMDEPDGVTVYGTVGGWKTETTVSTADLRAALEKVHGDVVAHQIST